MSTKQLDIEKFIPELEAMTPQQVLQWGVDTFGERFAVQSSMQKTAGVLMHMISQIAPSTAIIFVDTGVHFRDTLDLRDEFIRRFGVNIQSFHPEKTFEEQYHEYGRYLHESDDSIHGAGPGYNFCCRLRKELPYLAAVKGRFDAVAGGLMRSEGGRRARTPIITWDERTQSYKIYPLINWTEEQVDAYTAEHDLPLHALYARGYASIGCFTCTTPIQPGEDKRAGRWRHIREQNADLQNQPLYCGINFEDKKS